MCRILTDSSQVRAQSWHPRTSSSWWTLTRYCCSTSSAYCYSCSCCSYMVQPNGDMNHIPYLAEWVCRVLLPQPRVHPTCLAPPCVLSISISPICQTKTSLVESCSFSKSGATESLKLVSIIIYPRPYYSLPTLRCEYGQKWAKI